MNLKQSAAVPVSDALKAEDHFLSFGSMCRTKHYPFEQHKVMTDDGYFLTVFRIPGRKNESLTDAIAASRPPVLLWHGLMDSADSWIINDEPLAPAFVLANQGYDVWVGNSRGNLYSREHRFLDPEHGVDEQEFFDFSFEEFGLHDSNATISYILQETGKKKLSVAGVSMGGCQFLVGMMDNLSFYQNTVEVFVMLGPSTILNHTENRMFLALANNDVYIDTMKSLRFSEILPRNQISSLFYTVVCQAIPMFCELALDQLGEDDKYYNNDRIDEFFAHFPSGTSLKNLEHFTQIIESKRFQRFDYGLELNRLIYGADVPPEYDLSKISGMKIVHIVAEEDNTSHPLDNHWLNTQLGDNVIFYGNYRMGHSSFLLGTDISYLDDVISIFEQHPWS